MVHVFVSDEVPNQVLRELQHHGDLKHEFSERDIHTMKTAMVEHAEEIGWDILETDGDYHRHLRRRRRHPR